MNKRELTELAREMRRNPTPSEEIFWESVRNHRFCGVKFRRQQIIERFIVDFFVPEHRLVVEIDGEVHRGRKESDAVREQFLNDCGLRVLRFSAHDVELRLPWVLDALRQSLTPDPSPAGRRSLTPNPSPASGEGRCGKHKRSSPSPFTGEGDRGGED